MFDSEAAWEGILADEERGNQTAEAPYKQILTGAKPRQRLRQWAARAGIAVLALLVVLSGLGYFFVQRTLPTIDGTVRVVGLRAPVEVLRDRWGVPHIYARNALDAFYAQGYVSAQDRLWQMELFRRVGRGTLSEVLGKATLETDILFRTLGMYRTAALEARQIDLETRQALEAYAAGVNNFVETHRDRLPLEFTILGFQPEPWTPADSLTWGKVMAWDLGGNWERELLRANLLNKFGAEAMRELAPPYPATAPIIVPQGVSYDGFGVPRLAELSALAHPLGSGADIGSNNWVVDGSKSTTGKPLLADDPHLGIQMPSVWYEVHLNAPASGNLPALDVAGAAFPGVPFVVVGHNDRIAWGVTNTGPDVQDLYMEKINPDNPRQYLVDGQWQDMQVLVEEIKVKGEAEQVRRDVFITRHGPLVNGAVKGLGQPLAFRWTALDTSGTVRALWLLNRAQNWEQFREALSHFAVPAQNFVYADVDGNIGYQMPGQIPIRAKGDGLLPVPGWTSEYEWTGYIPYEKLPSVYNPPSHYIVTANNRVVDDDYPYLISLEWDPGYRAARVDELLRAKDKVGPEDFQRIQSDMLSLPARELASYLGSLQPKDEPSRKGLEHIRAWDGIASADSIGASIVESTYVRLLQNLYADAMGEELFKQYLGSAGNAAMPSLLALLKSDRSTWLTNVRSPAQPGREELALQSLRQAVGDLRQRFGDNPAEWRWGRLHTASFDHPLGQVKPLDRLFSFGPYEHGGSNFTVRNGGYSLNKPFFQKTVPSLREIIDLGDFDRSLFIHTTGQSGQPFSAHVADFAPLWLRGEAHPMLFRRELIEQNREGMLTLTP